MSVDYGYDVGGEVAGFLIIYLIVYLLGFGFSIASYVLSSLGTYTIAKRRGLNHPWMSWVPVLNYWILGSISDQYQYVTKGKNKNKRKWLVGLSCGYFVIFIVFYVVMLVMMAGFASNAVSANEAEMLGDMFSLFGSMILLMLPVIGLSIAVTVIRYMSLYDLYRSCDPNNCVMFLVLSILVNVTEPFFIFFSRKKDRGMPPRKPQPNGYIPEQPYYPPQQPQYAPQQPVYQPPEAPTYKAPEYQPPVYQPEASAYRPEPVEYAAPAEPVIPTAEPVVEPVAEPAAAPVIEPVVEPVTEPVVEPVAEPVAEPAAEPVVESAVEPEAPAAEQDPWDIG